MQNLFEPGTRVKITGTVRKGRIGFYVRPEKTAIGVLHRIEFESQDYYEKNEAGLYAADAFRKAL